MKNSKNTLFLTATIVALSFLTSCNQGLLGQGGTLNQAVIGHAIARSGALNTNIQGYLVGDGGKVGLRPQWNDVDLNWYVVAISIFIAPGGYVPVGKTSYFDQQYQAWCYDDLAIIEGSSAAWTGLSLALSNLTGSTTIGNRTFVALTFYEVPGKAIASDSYNTTTMYINGAPIYKKIMSSVVMKY